MEVKRGYKMTEVGVIPKDWGVFRLNELVRQGPKNGYSGRSGSIASGTPTLSLSATTSGRLILNNETVKFLEQQIPTESNLFLKTDDILVQRSNTIDLVGTTAIYTGPNNTYVYPDLMMRLRFQDRISALWFWRYANGYSGRLFFTSVAAGSTGSMPKISGETLRRMPVPIPPTKAEQEAIAEALSDADGLIESLEQLIAKKRQLKQGAMQELLTGKRRLPGFSGEWEVKRLGDIGDALIGLTYKPTDVRESGVLVLRSSNIYDGVLHFEDNVFVDTEIPDRIMVRPGDILICVRNGSRELIGKCAMIDEYAKGMTFGAFMAVFRTPFHNFVFHQFQSGVIKRQINEHLGATINQITNKSLNSFEVPLPPTEHEQSAIATILSDMDAEIAALETKLTKARQIKQGMMQELLTGRIRLT